MEREKAVFWYGFALGCVAAAFGIAALGAGATGAIACAVAAFGCGVWNHVEAVRWENVA